MYVRDETLSKNTPAFIRRGQYKIKLRIRCSSIYICHIPLEEQGIFIFIILSLGFLCLLMKFSRAFSLTFTMSTLTM